MTMNYQRFVALATRRLAELDIDVSASHLALSLNRASGILTDAAEAAVHRPNGLVWSSFRLLFTLWVLGEADQARLPELTSSNKAAVSSAVLALARKGLVERVDSPHDRRTKVVRLTASGDARVRDALVAQDPLFTDWAAVLTPEEQRQLAALLHKMLQGRVPMRDAADRPRSD